MDSNLYGSYGIIDKNKRKNKQITVASSDYSKSGLFMNIVNAGPVTCVLFRMFMCNFQIIKF